MSSNAKRTSERPAAKRVTADELARRQGVRPITSVDDLARPDLFESDDEHDAFLADLHAFRQHQQAT